MSRVKNFKLKVKFEGFKRKCPFYVLVDNLIIIQLSLTFPSVSCGYPKALAFGSHHGSQLGSHIDYLKMT